MTKKEHEKKEKDKKNPVAKSEKAMTPSEFYSKLAKEDKTSIANLAKSKPIEFIPTGSWVLNALIGDGTGAGKPGGIPRGQITEVFGDESSGKSTLGLSTCRQVQMMGGLPIYVDFERTFHDRYAQALGIDTSPDKFVLIQPNHFQHGAKMINDSLLMRPPLIVVDSVSAMLPREFLEGEVDEAGRVGLQAQLMSAFLSYITKKIDPMQGTNTALLFVNQMRSRIKMNKYDRGPNEESSGGNALKFYASVRIKFLKGLVEMIDAHSAITGKTEKKPVNVQVKAMIVKNKIDRPFMAGPIFIRFGEGFDNYFSIMELAVNIGVIKKAGAFLSFNRGGEEVFKVQGREQLRSLLAKDSKVYQSLRDSLVLKEDEQAKQEAAAEAEDEATGDEMDSILGNVAKSFKNAQKAKEEPAAE